MAVAPVAILAVGLLGFLLMLSLLLYAMKEQGEFHGVAFSKSRLLLQMAEATALLCVSVWAVLRSARSRVALLTCGGIALALLGTGVYELFTLVLQSEVGATLRIQAFVFFCAPLLALAAIGLSGTIRSVRSTPQHDIAQT